MQASSFRHKKLECIIKKILITSKQGYSDFHNQKAIFDYYISNFDLIVIRVIDSILVYLLSFYNNKIMKIPKYLHTLSRNERYLNTFKNLVSINWSFCWVG
jgi:hypothetical protein